MKKTKALICLAGLLLCCMPIFSACGEKESSGNTESTAEETTEKAAVQSASEQADITGTWQIIKDNGTKDSLFYYVFGGDKAQLVMDNAVFYSDYSLTDGKLTVQLFYNLNGTYSYKLADNGNTLELTDTGGSGTRFKLSRADDCNPVPEPPESPVIDKKLLGKWSDKDGAGMSYEFKENGIMINDSFGIMTIYAQYSAGDGTISLKYKQGTEVENKYTYSFNGDVLTIDGTELIKE